MKRTIQTGKFTRTDLEKSIRLILTERYGDRGSIKASREVTDAIFKSISNALISGKVISFSKLFSLSLYARRVGGPLDSTRRATVAWAIKPAKILRRRAIEYLFPEMLKGGDL